MVKEITRDIKQLDIAKKNLTMSFTILNHLFILVKGVESLESLINKNEYNETSIVFERVKNVIDHFEPYMHLKQIYLIKNKLHNEYWVRRELSNIMSKRRNEMKLIDMKLLMFSIQRTTSFEQLLASRFIGKTIQKPVDVNIWIWKYFN
jgi:hypothetical protein